uniref:Uncharacterized protein n=1 Tax=Glossina palpalis gambiensis TaxID=67801 RepID=A0A1B0AYZ6_9MUSC
MLSKTMAEYGYCVPQRFTSEPDLKVPSRPLEPLVQTKLRILCLKHSKRIKSFEISSSLALGSISDASLDNGRVV